MEQKKTSTSSAPRESDSIGSSTKAETSNSLSGMVSKLNFRQHAKMEWHSKEETRTWRKLERHEDSQKIEDAGARKRMESRKTVCFSGVLCL